MYISLFSAVFSFLITTSSFAQDECDPQFGCPTGVPNGGVGCDPQFGCPTGVPNNGVGCDPQFGCPTGVPNNGVGCDPQFGCPTGVPGNGVGCDPQFGCPTGTGGPSTFRGSATGSVYSVSADGYGAFYNHATGEWFTPQRRGSEIIGYIGSKGTQVVSNGDGSFRTSSGDYFPKSISGNGNGQSTNPQAPYSPSPTSNSGLMKVGSNVKARFAANMYVGTTVVGQIDPTQVFTIYKIQNQWTALKDKDGNGAKGWVNILDLTLAKP